VAEKSQPIPSHIQPVKREVLPLQVHDRDQLTLLHQIRGELETSNDLSSSLKRVLQLVLEAVQATSGSILLIDRKQHLLVGELMYGGVAHTKTHGEAYDVLDEGLAGWVARHRQAVLVSSTREDDRWLRRTWDENEGMSRSAMSVPLMTDGHILGVLTAVHARANGFDENDFALISTVAGLFALSFSDQLLSGVKPSNALEDTVTRSEERM
jgi:GAF domain-containing protein